jgi:hypothetical protein
MSIRPFAFAAGLGFILSTAACVHGNYRVVKTVPNAGEVALVGPQEEAHQKAEGYIAGRCPSGFDILEEGEAVVGQTSSSHTRAYGPGRFAAASEHTEASTTDKREWRIKYQCKGGAPAASAGGAEKQGKIEEVVVYF